MGAQIQSSLVFKILTCAGSALLISFCLFYFMSVLISHTKDLRQKKDSVGLVDFIRQRRDSSLNEKKRTLPKKKPTPNKVPKMNPLTSAISNPEKLNMNMPLPDVKSLLRSGGLDIGGFGGQVGSGVMPLVRIEPQYPRQAAMQGIEGWVMVKFDITPAGKVENVKVLDAKPPRIFNVSAVRAVRKWKYRPKVEGGTPVAQKGNVVQVDFTLD